MIAFIISIPAVERIVDQREARRPAKKNRNWLGTGILIVLIPIALIFSTLYTVNLFHKLVPIGQTTVEGHIVDRDFDDNYTKKADYSTYDLTISFTANDGETYQVEKGVTQATFAAHESTSSIDVKYRNNNPYDIFINTKGIGEIVFAIVNVQTMIFLLCLLVFYMLFKFIFIKAKPV